MGYDFKEMKDFLKITSPDNLMEEEGLDLDKIEK